MIFFLAVIIAFITAFEFYVTLERIRQCQIKRDSAVNVSMASYYDNELSERRSDLMRLTSIVTLVMIVLLYTIYATFN